MNWHYLGLMMGRIAVGAIFFTLVFAIAAKQV